jgi:DNA-binding GntR family transcriptional regulator
MSEARPSTHGRLTELAYARLRDEILRGQLPVGSVLGEHAVARRLGSSRTPVRQALRLLREEGLLEVGSRRQLVVRGIPPERREEILLVREALEAVALRRACERMALGELDLLRVSLLRQRRAAEAGREDEFLELDEEFHLRIADGAGLPILHRYLEQLRGFVRLLRLGRPRMPEQLLAVVAEHEAIVEALERRDVDAALAALAAHLRPGRDPESSALVRQGTR